jgi:hypothetical protein
MRTRHLLSLVMLAGTVLVAFEAKSDVMISTHGCNPLNTADTNYISYSMVGVATSSTSTTSRYVVCPMVREIAAAGASTQQYWVESLFYSSGQTLSCTLTILDWTYAMAYQQAQTFTSTLSTQQHEFTWNVPIAQSPTWGTASVTCSLPARGNGMIYSLGVE